MQAQSSIITESRKLRRTVLPLTLAAVLSGAFPSPAQAPASPASISQTPATSGETPVASGPSISLPFFLLAKNEDPIEKVTKDDITIGEDNHPEVIQSIVAAGDQPISLAIVVDTRSSLGGMLQTVRAPLQKFVDTTLSRPSDQAAVIDFNDDAGLDSALTTVRDKTHKALDRLSSKPAGAYSTAEVDKNVGGNVLFDALFLASDEVLKDKPGRKVIIVATDGLDRGSKENILSAIEAAQRTHALIYTIEFPSKEKNEPQPDQNQNRQGNSGGYPGGGYPGGGGGYPGGGGGYPGGGGGFPGSGGGRRNGGAQRPPSPARKDSKKVLVQLSGDTGGHAYEVSSKLSIDQALAKIADQLKAEQMLTYALSKDDREEGFHRLQWTTKQKDHLLQAPGGFYIDRP